MLTAFWSGFSPLIFPAWLYLPEAHMPPLAEFSGSLKRTSPSTTARWQSIRGGYLKITPKTIIKMIFRMMKKLTAFST